MIIAVGVALVDGVAALGRAAVAFLLLVAGGVLAERNFIGFHLFPVLVEQVHLAVGLADKNLRDLGMGGMREKNEGEKEERELFHVIYIIGITRACEAVFLS